MKTIQAFCLVDFAAAKKIIGKNEKLLIHRNYIHAEAKRLTFYAQRQ